MNILTLTFGVAILYLCCLSTTHQQEPHNITHWAKSRQKRFLIFQTQGVHKFIISLALPVDLQDKKAWRTLSGAWNFQWQHLLPLTPLYWWNSTYFPTKVRSFGDESRMMQQQEPSDLTATFLYSMLENYMNNKGVNGRECMQRSICENAQVEYVGGVLDHIYKRLLTPEMSMDDYYRDSFTAGSTGVDCYKTYFGCPIGMSVFDQYVRIHDVK